MFAAGTDANDGLGASMLGDDLVSVDPLVHEQVLITSS